MPINNNGIIQGTIPQLISDSHNEELTKAPDFQEINIVVMEMDPSSASGPDGYSGWFFKACRSIIKEDFCAAIQSFFLNR